MTKKTNWKAKAAEMYHISIAQAQSLQESGNAKDAPFAFMNLGAAQAIQDLLIEYGVDVEEETPKIILAK